MVEGVWCWLCRWSSSMTKPITSTHRVEMDGNPRPRMDSKVEGQAKAPSTFHGQSLPELKRSGPVLYPSTDGRAAFRYVSGTFPVGG